MSWSLSELASSQSGHGGSIQVSCDSDDVAVITMDRGENRMNDEFIDQMNAALDQVQRLPKVKAVITTSQGKFYCIGLDLAWLKLVRNSKPDHIPVFLKRWHLMQLRLLTFPVPTIAAINGHTYAGGGVMSMCHDYRVMQTDRGWWCLNEARLGIQMEHWIVDLFRTKLSGKGARSLLETILFGRRFTAAEAKNAGIVDETCGAAELMSKARSLLNRVVPNDGIDRRFVEYTKKQIFESALVAADNLRNIHSVASRL